LKTIKGKTKDGASAIGIIGDPDEETIQTIRDMTGKQVRIIERNGKIKIIIGKGLGRTVIHVPRKK
jgi:hypothetical protein